MRKSFMGLFGDNNKTFYLGHQKNGIYLMNIQIGNNTIMKKILKL